MRRYVDDIRKGGYGNNRVNKFDQKGITNHVKKRFNDDSSRGIRCFKCGGRGQIQSKCTNVLKKNISYNTTLEYDNNSRSPIVFIFEYGGINGSSHFMAV